MEHKNLQTENGKLKIFSASAIFLQEAACMDVTLRLDPTVTYFYSRLAEATGLPLEQVLSDALFKLAGELSLQALKHPQ